MYYTRTSEKDKETNCVSTKYEVSVFVVQGGRPVKMTVICISKKRGVTKVGDHTDLDGRWEPLET